MVGTLARHSDSAVNGPVLAKANAVPDKDLLALVDKDKADPKMLTKIAARAQISEAVTDALIKRGSSAIQRTTIDNPDARISERASPGR